MNKKYIFTFAVLTVLFMGVVSTSNASAIAIGPFAGPPPRIIQNVNSTNATAQSNSTNATAQSNSTNATAQSNSTNATAQSNSTNATAQSNSTNATAQSRIVPVVSAQFTTSSTNSSKQVLIAAGIGAGGSNGTCVTQNNCFNPHVVNITTGQKVTWNNTDNTIHTVTSGKPSDSNTGKLFDKSISSGKTVSITFKKSGTVNYFCKIHPWMTGQVVVENTNSNSSQNTSNSTSAQNATSSNETNSNSSNIQVTTNSSNQTHP